MARLLLCDESAAQAPPLAERLQAAALADAPCGLSLGVAVREDGESLEATIARADAALYRARRARRGEPPAGGLAAPVVDGDGAAQF